MEATCRHGDVLGGMLEGLWVMCVRSGEGEVSLAELRQCGH